MNNLSANHSFCWEQFAKIPGNPYFFGEDALRGFNCLFVWYSDKNDYSAAYYPLAFGIMASLVRMNGGTAQIEYMGPHNENPSIFSGRSLVCFFPQVAAFDILEKMCMACRRANPDVPVAVFNSEQHQHEMMLCSPQAETIGFMLMHQIPVIDFCLIGEAEYSFIALCNALFDGGGAFHNLPHALYRENGKIHVTTRSQKPVQFESLPFPSRDHLERSLAPSGVNSASIRIQSSRGCISACRYCVESCVNLPQKGRTKAWIEKPLALFIDEIKMLSERYGAYYFNINDSSFEDPGRRGIGRMLRFCSGIKKLGIAASFKIHLRAETLDRLDDKAFDLLKEAGVDIIVVGVESGLPAELDAYGKRATAEIIQRSIRRVDRDGRFFLLTGHMMFSPLLHLDDLPAKVAYLRKIGRGWDYLNLSNNLLVFYGTAFHRAIEMEGLVEKTPGEVRPVVPYRYRDPRVGKISNAVSALRTSIPEVISLQNLLYDACNMRARFSNPSNGHLTLFASQFHEYEQVVNDVKEQLQDIYKCYWDDCYAAVTRGLTIPDAEYIAPDIAGLYDRLCEGERKILTSLHVSGLNTDRLHLKTWLSVINTAKNTSWGRI